jgi:hypothetical protein
MKTPGMQHMPLYLQYGKEYDILCHVNSGYWKFDD